MATQHEPQPDSEAEPTAKPAVVLKTPAATLQRIEGIADDVKALLEALLRKFQEHCDSNTADYKEFRAQMAHIQADIETMRTAYAADMHSMSILSQMEHIVNRINQQEPTAITAQQFLDQIDKVKDGLKQDIDDFLAARLQGLRRDITKDITDLFDSSRVKEEKKRHEQIVNQTWIIGGITIVLGLLSILATLNH